MEAFDLVDHLILIDIIFLYKYQGPDLNLIYSYRRSRQQVIDRAKIYPNERIQNQEYPKGHFFYIVLNFHK